MAPMFKSIQKYAVLIIIAVLCIYLIVSIKQAKGPSIRIVSTSPSEDYIVKCTWHSDTFSLHGGKALVSETISIIKSGETFECGYSFWGGVYQAYKNVSVTHPIFTRTQSTEIDGILVIRPIHALQVIKEEIAKFNEGYWNDYKNPGFQFSNALGGCGVSFAYLDTYNNIKKVNKKHFRELYEEPMQECLSIVVPIYKKYRPRSSEKYTTGKAWSDNFWNSTKWDKYDN